MSVSEDQQHGGSLRAAISDSVVRITADYTGRGPTRARTTINGEWIFVTLSGTLTQGERKPEPAVAEKALSGLASLAAELGLTAREREVLEHLALGAAAIAHPSVSRPPS